MADETDRHTGLEADQIKDHTLTAREFQTVDNVVTPKNWQLLGYDNASGKMKWIYNFGNKILE